MKSTFAQNIKDSTVLDELHIAVVDQDGLFTGTKGTVLETFPFVSQASNAKATDGTTLFAKNIINETSEYIYMFDLDSTYTAFGTDVTASSNAYTNGGAVVTESFVDGVNSPALGTSEFSTGYDLLEDKDIVELDFLIAPGMVTTVDQTTVVNDLV